MGDAHDVTDETSGFEEITIGDSRDGFRIAPRRGGIVTALWLHGEPLLYLDRATFNDPGASVRGGIPVLFPICGPLREGRARLGEAEIALKQHGFARSLPWREVERGEHHITLALADSPETRASWPFAFEVRCTYRLTQGALRIEHAVENRSSAEMPFSFGFHPYFATPDKQALLFHIPARHAAENPFGEPQAFTGLEPAGNTIDLTFTDATEPRASFDDRATGRRITVSACPEYRYLVFWTLADRPFCCLEPWTARGDALNTGHDLMRLAPGETRALRMEISVDRIDA
ncbi:MAG: aldose epimerase [Proteobacteria bacterium]|nr:aldose epimerase [Pseudomonadota bacterium]